MISFSRTKCKQKKYVPPRKVSIQKPTRFASALANLLLSFSSGWALRTSGGYSLTPLSSVTFTFFLVYSILGVFAFGNPEYGEHILFLYFYVLDLSIMISFPCFLAQLIVLHDMPSVYLVCLFFFANFVGILSFINYPVKLLSESLELRSKPKNCLIFCSVLGALYISYMNYNYYGIAAALTYGHNYFFTKPTGTAFNVPSVDIFAYELIFFNFFAVKAVLD